MANENMITTSALIEKFWYTINNKWGYIWGSAGILWTEAKQKQKVNYMESRYGSNWKKSVDARSDNYYYTALYGDKWIGHYVADCSGMFVWAFREFGMEMSHISSNIYISYCNKKGKLTDALKKSVLPGSAVFTGDTERNHPHVGLYVGDGTVIEAASTQKGVITSKITDKKWKWYGELKGVYYGDTPAPTPTPTPVPEGKAVVTGKNVALRQGPSKDTPVMTRVVTGTTVDIAKVEGWTYVRYNKREGFMMNQYIQIHDDYVIVTGVNVAVRAGTGTDTKVLMRIPTNTVVPRIPLPDDWEYVAYGSRKGFMMKEYLKEG